MAGDSAVPHIPAERHGRARVLRESDVSGLDMLPNRVRIVKERGKMSAIHFEAQLFEINSWPLLKLPEDASAQLPSRGMTMVAGTINGVPFKTMLEPDGRYASGQTPSHWFQPDQTLLDDACVQAGDTVHVSLEPTNEWIEPDVPEDLKHALATSPKAEALWHEITPLAR